jgi:flagellar hook-basal body complex protein FliE
MNLRRRNGTPNRKPATLLALLLAGSLSACASMPAKSQATEKLTATAQLLTAARDAERAAAAGAADAPHRTAEQALAAALDAQSKAAAAIQAWKAGDPPPPALHDLVVNVEAAQVAVQQLTGNPSVMKVADLLQQASDAIAATQGVLTAGE